MENKIGIITYHRAINYGAILQAYALQTKLNEFGAQSIILDYRNKRLEKIHSRKNITDCKKPKEFARYLLLYRNFNKRHDKFRDFSKNYLKLSSPMYSIDDLAKCERKYDLFIVGSDQVWNYEINGMDYAYFLDFVKDKSKNKSYAASFGLSKIPEEYKQTYKKLLIGFDSILIREKQGARIIKELLFKECPIVLDPTMLLSKDKWLILSNNTRYFNERYILVYAFGDSPTMKDLAINISRKTGFKILWIANTYKINKRIKYIKFASPEEFISLFSNAEYIITNSFHGTAFSINFNKQFFTELRDSSRVNSRLEDILDIFGLQDRRIISNDASVINSRINYETVNKKLENEREKSIRLLKNSIHINEN